MTKRAKKSDGSARRGWWPSPSTVVAAAAIFVALGGTAMAADGLIHAADIAPGAVTSMALRNGGVEPNDLSMRTRALLADGQGPPGAKGDDGTSGSPSANGANGPNGANGVNGTDGADGIGGDDGTNGTNGVDGADGTNGVDGAKGTNGVDGADGTVTPLSATKGLTALATAAPPVTVVELVVPAGNYVVLAKTQLSHTGAGDSVECTLKAGTSTLDQIAIKTLPALAAIPASLQAVTTTASPTQLSVQCRVLVASGEANFSSLIAIPTA